MNNPSHPQAVHFRSMVNRHGNLNVHGTRGRRNPFSDLYHYFFSLSWPSFFLHVAAVYFLMNISFGVLYYLCKAGPSLFQCVVLSIESMNAVDYSRISAGGMGAYLLMTVQAFLGLLTIAMITGLFYAKFSRATARVIFSNKVIISKHNGRDCLHFRIANERLNQIAEAHMALYLTLNEVSLEGERSRKFYDLELERNHTPLFALSWTVRHYIDEKSPLFALEESRKREAQMGIVATLTGIDETFSQPIIARHAYSLDDVVYNKRFKDIITWQGKKVHIDLKSIHDLNEPQAVLS